MKKILTGILFLILILSMAISVGCLVYPDGSMNGGVNDGTNNGSNSGTTDDGSNDDNTGDNGDDDDDHPPVVTPTDVFAIEDMIISKGASVQIVFSDASDSAVSYEYDSDMFNISKGYISVEPITPAGTYTIIATNAYNTVEFTVTVVGDNVSLTLKNNVKYSPVDYGDYVPSGTTVTIKSGNTIVDTGVVANKGLVSFEVDNGNYVVCVDGYKEFNLNVNGYYSTTVECDYNLFTSQSATNNYKTNGYIDLSSALDFTAEGIVYAEMTIYAPSNIATAQSGNKIGATVFDVNTKNYNVNNTTSNVISFGGYWNQYSYRLRWTGDHETSVKTFETDLLNKLTNQSQGVKIAVAIKDGIVYSFVEGADGELEPLSMSGGPIYALDIKGISTNLSAKVSDIKYATSLEPIKILGLGISLTLNDCGRYNLDNSTLSVEGSHDNGYTVTSTSTGYFERTKAVQNGYYDLNDNSVISFDFEYTVDSSSKYYPELRFNDSATLQLCIWEGSLRLKYEGTEVVSKSTFNGDNVTGTFVERFAVHADNSGALAVYSVKKTGETLLYTTASNANPFDFSMVRRVDVCYKADNGNEWTISNLFVRKSVSTASMSYTSSGYVTFENQVGAIAYKKSATITFVPLDGYAVTAVKVDGMALDFATKSGVVTATFTKYDAKPSHTVVVEGTMGSSNYKFKTSALASYKIVYDGDYSDLSTVATKLKNTLSSKYGVNLTVGSDTAISASVYEILIGDTNRYSTLGKVMKYSVTVGEGKFKINVGGVYSAEKAIDYLVSNVFTGGDLTLATGEYYSTSLRVATKSVASGANLRLMSTNILSTTWDSSVTPAKYRAEIYAGTLVSYAPDAVGVQELDAGWNSALPDMFAKIKAEFGYNYVLSSNIYQSKNNFTSLLYRADKFNISNETVEVYDWWVDPQFNHDYYMRNVTYAQLTSKTNSSFKFIVANTHWSPNGDHVGKTLANGTKISSGTLKGQERSELNSLLTTLVNKYSMPIFLTGDFNTSYVNLKPNAYLSINSSFTKIIDSNNPQTDYIFGKSGAFTAKASGYFRVEGETLTDHNFVYADLAI